jgi:hypothetical protein
MIQSLHFCLSSENIEQTQLLEQYRNYSVLSLLDYGCLKNTSHDFAEVQLIYGQQWIDVFSGAILIGDSQDNDWTKQDGKHPPCS